MVYTPTFLQGSSTQGKVVEDAPSEQAMKLELDGKIKPRSKITILIGELTKFVNEQVVVVYIGKL